jgi:hypothetical protein
VRRLAPLLPLAPLLLGACGGGAPVAAPTTAPTSPAASRPATPRPTPTKARATATPSRPASKAPTTPPPPTGDPIGTQGAFLALVPPDRPRVVNGAADCATVFPEVAGARCGALDLAGGSALWVTGTVDGVPMVRVLTQEDAGYVTRYAGRQDPAAVTSAWRSVTALAAPLTGQGTDGLVLLVRLGDGAATYDVLTWVKGGPLVLRAHRGPLADGRLAARNGRLEDYALLPDGRYAHRTVAWDGRWFRLGPADGVAATQVPPS